MGSIYTKLVNHARWRLDNVKGKTLCLIELKIPKLTYDSKITLENITLNFTPSDKFQDELINRWLEAESNNDKFQFPNPIMNKTRPSQLKRKLKKLSDILVAWERRLL